MAQSFTNSLYQEQTVPNLVFSFFQCNFVVVLGYKDILKSDFSVGLGLKRKLIDFKIE
jgi:hypothetical protein